MEAGEKKSLLRKYFSRNSPKDSISGRSGRSSFLSQAEASGPKSLGETRPESGSTRSLREYQPGPTALDLEPPEPLRPVTAGGLPLSRGIKQHSLFDKLQNSHTETRARRYTDAAPVKGYVELDHDTPSRPGTSQRKRFSEDTADRNLGRVRPDGHHPTTGLSVDILDHNLSGYPRVVAEEGRYSETVADRNISMSTTSVLSNSSSDLSHIPVWGEQLAALQLANEADESFDQYDHTGKQKRSGMLDRIASQHGTTVKSVPPERTDVLSDSYDTDSELYLASSAEEIPRYEHARVSSPEAAPYGGNSRMSSLEPTLYSSQPAHKPMSSLDKPFQDQLHIKSTSVRSVGSSVSSLRLVDEGSLSADPIVVQPLNLVKPGRAPPPIPQRATQHRVPDHLAAIGTAITKDDSHSSSSSSSEVDHATSLHAPMSHVAIHNVGKTLYGNGQSSPYASARDSHQERSGFDSRQKNERTSNHVARKHDYGQEAYNEAATDANSGPHSRGSDGRLGDSNAKAKLAAAGFNLTNTAETHIYEKIAPAVTKEVVIPTIREIRQKHITREIHQHDVFHRILPVRQTEILPARHWMQLPDGTRREIPASAAPVGSTSRLILETRTDPDAPPLVPRKFTACNLEALPRDFKNRVDADGVIRSRTTWIHPPVLQTGGYLTGQTIPFEFEAGSEMYPDSGRIATENDWRAPA